mgnify:CR=1 FL=1
MGKVMLEVNNLKTKYVTRFHEDVYAVDGVSLKMSSAKAWDTAKRLRNSWLPRKHCP